ncbi:MAG: ABC transporter substrate-binding protein [Gemmatimonadota bacterium]|nr:ABC transporter substrate-binding protein [Gemmatimonadota bacterium]
MRNGFGREAVALLLALVLAACGGGDGGAGGARADAGPAVPGGTAIFGILGDFQAFNTITNTYSAGDEVMKFMLFTPLIQFDQNLNPVPYLAERWELTDNNVTFHLRDDVRWHDGQPLTAEDVKFTFDLAKNPEAASLLGSAYLNMVQSATVIDPHTIRFDFVAPHAQAMDGFWWAPMPRHLLQNVAPAELAQAPFSRNPTGSGPFRFVRWDAGQSLTLEANDEFTPALGGRPNLDRVVFRIIPEATTMVTELLSGTTDAIGYTLLPDQAQQVQSSNQAELHHYPHREFFYIGWNPQRPQFADPAVRRALTMGINRAQIIEALMGGFGQPAEGMIPPWSPLYTEIQPLPYDPAAARQLLAQAGWQDRNGDGIVENAQGQPFRFTLITNQSNQLRVDIATVVQQQLRAIGVDAQLRTLEFQSMLQQHRGRDYDAILSGWILDTFRVDPTPLFSCEQARTPNSANRTGYCNPRADQLIQQGMRTTDAGQAQQVWAEFSRVLQQDQPLTFLFWSEDLAGVGPRLQGVEMDVRSKLVNVSEWWIPENRRRQ